MRTTILKRFSVVAVTMFKGLAVTAAFLGMLILVVGCSDNEDDDGKNPVNPNPDPSNPVVVNPRYGTFEDPRDNLIYRIVDMPDGKTWFAENLNYRAPDTEWTMNDVEGRVGLGSKGSWCYDNSADSCAKYGRLYTLAAALEACPAGWHLPTDAEWDTLVVAVGGDLDNYGYPAGTNLKSVDGWWCFGDHCYNENYIAGIDKYGFSALPSGYLWYDGHFTNGGYSCHLWTAPTAEDADLGAYIREIGSDYEDVYSNWYGKNKMSSVRCVRD